MLVTHNQSVSSYGFLNLYFGTLQKKLHRTIVFSTKFVNRKFIATRLFY